MTKLSVGLVIGKDGHVLKATPIAGPPKSVAELASVMRKAIFQPFMVLDTPVEVETTYEMEVEYRLEVH